jgi:RHS repeat-associated protein
VHADHLNTPRLVTDTSNNVRWSWESDPFGTTIPNENPQSLGMFAYNLRFPGQQYDPIVGLHYNYFRDYDPATGRYSQSDPIGLRGGPNTYAYANGNPAMLADPLGLLALGWSETWTDSDNLGGKNRGGYTEGWVENVKCGCQGSGSCWTLVDCSALLHVKVQILASAWGAEDKFYRRSEAEHVADFRSNFGQIFAAGKAAEDSVRGMQFSSKAACEAHANKAVSTALWNAANNVAKASEKTYDLTGRHTWHWYYRLF